MLWKSAVKFWLGDARIVTYAVCVFAVIISVIMCDSSCTKFVFCLISVHHRYSLHFSTKHLRTFVIDTINM